jgi:hypothetical protein
LGVSRLSVVNFAHPYDKTRCLSSHASLQKSLLWSSVFWALSSQALSGVSSGSSPLVSLRQASLLSSRRTSLNFEVVSLGVLLVSVWSLMALFMSFLSLPLIVAQPERGGSLVPKSNSFPPLGVRGSSRPTLTARAKAFSRLLPPKPSRGIAPYARCCPVSSFSIRKAW